MKTIFFLILWATPLTFALAGGDESPPSQSMLYCPPLSALKKDPETLTWYASGGWKSYDISFINKITQFSGAQWRGTNLGQIFCVYRGEATTEFPIFLASNVLAFAPHGGRWSPDLGGYRNCETPRRQDCPFTIRIQEAPVDVYEQAEKLKIQAPKSSRPGF